MTSNLRRFRFVLQGDSAVRLMENAEDEPSTWRFPFVGTVHLVTVQDVVVVGDDDLPRHLGFNYTVEIDAETIDDAADEAHAMAETVAFLIAAARRAPVGRVQLQLAYEITPGVAERAFRQWYWNPPVPIGKPVVDQSLFGELYERIDKLSADPTAERRLWRLITSISWFRQALDDTDAIFRFHKLWVALEALNPLLDKHYKVEDTRGFQGLRSLADDGGLDADVVSRALGVRRDMYHALDTTPDALRTRIDALLPTLEDLCAAGWKKLLGMQHSFPSESVVPHPLYIRLDGVLVHADESTWSTTSHPQLEATFQFNRVETEPGSVTFTMAASYNVQNTDAFRPTGQGMWGPTGYRPMTLERGPDVVNPPVPPASPTEEPPTS